MKKKQPKEEYLPCIICKKRRIKPIHRYILLGQTRFERVSEGMCKICAWNEVKERCIICKKVLDKGYPQLLAHCIEHYKNKEYLYNDDGLTKMMAINLEIIPPAHYDEPDVKDVISCNICQERFPLYGKDNRLKSYPFRWISHIKEHYSDSELMVKDWIAQRIVNFNYEAVIRDNEGSKKEKEEYRLLTENESKAYAEALHRIRITEDEITKRKNK